MNQEKVNKILDNYKEKLIQDMMESWQDEIQEEVKKLTNNKNG